MDRELIRSWLQLPPGDWPPDHYTLLGLRPGPVEVARVEQQVHERMQQLRCYQLTHPELATEAMNYLAQALVCLTNPDTKKAYDQELSKQLAGSDLSRAPTTVASGTWLSGGTSEASPAAFPDTAAVPPTEEPRFFDWQTEPPPFRQPPGTEFVSGDTADNFTLPGLGATETFPDVAPLPPLESALPPIERELLGKFSRLGLRSKGALYYQIARTRQLLWAWQQVGKYLNQPTRLVNRPAEATDLIHHMGVIRELLPSTPLLLGEAGHPGYLVLALARQQMIVPTLQTLLPSQREALARDWQSCHALLRNVRQLLRQRLRVVRSRRGWRHGVRVIGASLRDHPGLLLLLLALVTMNLANALLRARWPEQLICLAALAGIRLAFWLYSLQPFRVPSLPTRKLRLPRKHPRTQAPA